MTLSFISHTFYKRALLSLAGLLVLLFVAWLGWRTPVANGQFASALQPAHPSALACEELDPTVPLYGATHGERISKGLNLPPYLEDDLVGRIQRLQASGVNWVRLEFMASQSPTAGNPLSQIDLAYYDQLVNSLCQAGIAVLGLVDYQTLKRSDWAISNTVSADYLAEFTTVANQLTSHFADRIGVWEIWNEQDLAGTALTTEAYAQLLHDSYWAIQAAAQHEADGQDRVVFGGLGRIDPRALNYLKNVYAALAANYPGERHPFDILALHPYSSELYGIETDPAIYFRWPEGEGPTVIHKFLKLMAEQGDANMPIWITELGWNRARLDGPSVSCPAISSGLVTEEEQVEYLNRGFDILLRETAWPGQDAPIQSVTKIFWYQYRDTGVYVDCAGRNGERARPFATPSPLQAASEEEWRPVAWWFGLYNGAFQPNQVQAAFRCYATGGNNCPAVTPTFTPTFTPTATATATATQTPMPTPSGTSALYLPIVVRDAVLPIVQPTSTPVPTRPAP